MAAVAVINGGIDLTAVVNIVLDEINAVDAQLGKGRKLAVIFFKFVCSFHNKASYIVHKMSTEV